MQEEQRAGISDPMHFAYPAFAMLLARPKSAEVTVKFALENRTKHTIRFRVGASASKCTLSARRWWLRPRRGRVRF